MTLARNGSSNNNSLPSAGSNGRAIHDNPGRKICAIPTIVFTEGPSNKTATHIICGIERLDTFGKSFEQNRYAHHLRDRTPPRSQTSRKPKSAFICALICGNLRETLLPPHSPTIPLPHQTVTTTAESKINPPATSIPKTFHTIHKTTLLHSNPHLHFNPLPHQS